MFENSNLHLEVFVKESLQYLNEENRRKTFKKWVFTKKEVCNADKMAEAGFIYTGTKQEPDSVKCFFCAKPLDGWEATDDPWKEHLSHAPNCSFAKLQQQQDNITMETFLDLREELLYRTMDIYMDALRDYAEKAGKAMFKDICRILDK
ncbi:unnamed protein product [Phaedon cochleariae]|uniref:Uncharacterized protein n=1 Tax=Phaedon cochleariae TaxID=80249 RepID=A0A9N9SB36_PHACE|nr:unnamed protein product [Phaedon cochleariae]